MEMLRVWAILGLACSLPLGFLPAAVEPPVQPIKTVPMSATETFDKARDIVLEQLKQSTNYTCTEQLSRTHFVDRSPGPGSCRTDDRAEDRRPFMHDRLRLDVAVSNSGEIFSWHGGKQFSSSGIDSIVKTGAVSSGAFTGYMKNVFLAQGVVLRMTEHRLEQGTGTIVFQYTVPLQSSKLQVGSKRVVAPFHGSFELDDKSLQLKMLEVVIDPAPLLSGICHASMAIRYQVVTITNEPALVPQTYTLDIHSANQSSSSRTQFSDCHAFRGESVIHYLSLEDDAQASAPAAVPIFLPKGLKLQARLLTKIDDKTSFAGDPVDGVLTRPVNVRGTDIHLQKGARLHGVITRLEFYYAPAEHYLLGIHFESITESGTTYPMVAILQTPAASQMQLMQIYRTQRQGFTSREGEEGTFVFAGKTFQTSSSEEGVWITTRNGGE